MHQLESFNPHILKVTRGQWYVVGKCPNENHFRYIPLNRILNENLEVNEDETFVRDSFDPLTYWDGCVGITKIGKPITVKFHLKNGEVYNNVDYLRAIPIIEKGQTIKELEIGLFEITLKNIHMGPELVRVIRSLGLVNITNVSPKWLYEDLSESGERKQFVFSIRLPKEIKLTDFEADLRKELRIKDDSDNAAAELTIEQIPNKREWRRITLTSILVNSVLALYIQKIINDYGEINFKTKMGSFLN